MKHKARFGALAAVAALALTGCTAGGGAGGATEGTGGAVEGQQVGTVGTQDQIQEVTQFCGDEELTVAYADGFGGNSWRKITRALFEAEAAKCDNITQVLYTDAQGDSQKAISDLNSLVAQGADVIIVWADAGEAILPTIQRATEAGVQVVPIIATPGGEPGVDYVDLVGEDVHAYGAGLAEWTIKNMGEEGNLVMLGGQAGNPYSQAVYDGVVEVVEQYPNVTLLNADMGNVPVDTGWEPGKTKQVIAGLITKYGEIDGIVADYGGGSVGGVEAFLDAGKPVPVWSANDSNEFACLWYEHKDEQPGYQIATMSSRNWVINVALHKGLAAHNGILNEEPSIYELDIFEDSTDPDKQPQCEPDLPNDAILSSTLTVDQLKELFN